MSTEKALTLSTTVRHIQHILLSDYECALEEKEVDRKKKKKKWHKNCTCKLIFGPGLMGRVAVASVRVRSWLGGLLLGGCVAFQ